MKTKEEIREYHRMYYQKNREHILAMVKENNANPGPKRHREKVIYIVSHTYYNIVVEDTNRARLCCLLRTSLKAFRKALQDGSALHDWTIDVRDMEEA